MQYPTARLFAAGYSLGSLILCKYLAEFGNGTWKASGVKLLGILPLPPLLSRCTQLVQTFCLGHALPDPMLSELVSVHLPCRLVMIAMLTCAVVTIRLCLCF